MDEELKIVIQVKGTRALVGIQKKDTDPVIEPIEAASVEEILTAVPGILARAREKWATSPKNPKYEGPAIEKPPAPVTQRQPVTAKPAASAQNPQKSMF